jgi:endoglucanase
MYRRSCPRPQPLGAVSAAAPRRTPSRTVAGGLLELLLMLTAILLLLAGPAAAARLVELSVLDRDILVVHVSDGEVIHHEGATGEEVIRHSPELATATAGQSSSWTVTSSDDPGYASGLHPVACHRKTKLNGHAQMEWVGSDFRYESTYEHWIYLELPSPMQQGMSYTVAIDAGTAIDQPSATVTFDIFNTPSEAVHVNLVGYATDAPHKAADLYHWMGDGGPRDYSRFEGNTVWATNVATSESTPVGQVAFWMASGSDVFWNNLTGSDVWTVDLSVLSNPGTYRLVVDGVGCSRDFEIAGDVYAEPFRTSVLGTFYMRVGEANPNGIVPPPRTPLYLPGVSPPDTTVYLTTMQPWHPEWDSFSSGDVWDRPNDWIPYRKAGNPTNPDAWGGHSDAADWDRHLAHVVNIYDLLLPFLLTGGAIDDDDIGITESGNDIPDLLDEARNEVDFWLRLRDGAAYSHGLTNPNGSNELFQAGPTAIAAWANAVNAAMLADAFRIAGEPGSMEHYRDEAVTAYTFADGLADPMLDEGIEVDTGLIRGRDLKMTAAAHLYNVTGDTAWEDVVHAESVCATGPAAINNSGWNQIWGTAAYLVTPQPVHYPTLHGDMTSAIIAEARAQEADLIDSRPSRRATDNVPAYFRTGQHVDRTIIAHAVADDHLDRAHFRKALALEADWGLGRNPMNRIHMTTAFTPLAAKRSVPEAYTSGMDDGVPGVHPGHTPYMNLDDWYPAMTMGRPSALYENSHPGNVPDTWPIGECYFPSRWVWAHNEFTPRQTMRGKAALLGYLYGLGVAGPALFSDGFESGDTTAWSR